MSFPDLNLKENTQTVYYILVVLGIFYTICSVSVRYLRRKYHKFVDKYQYFESSVEKIEQISKEFKPNHGSSIKDILNKVQLDLSKNTELTEKISVRQKWILDNREMPIFESDEEGKCIWVNAAYLELIKRDMNFVIGNGWKNVIAPEDRARVTSNWESCVKDGRDSEDTYSIMDSDGNKHLVFTAACKTGKFGYVGALKILK